MIKRFIFTVTIFLLAVSQAWAVVRVGRATGLWQQSATVGTNIDVNVGFTPTTPWFVLVQMTGHDSATDAITGARHAQVGVGFATSSTSRRGRNLMSLDNGDSSFTGYAMFDDAILKIVDTTSKTVDGALDIVGEITNGIRFIVDDQTTGSNPRDYRFDVLVIDGITDAKIFNILEPAATGNTDHTGAGVDDADLFFFISSTFNTTVPDVGAVGRLAFGAAHSSGQGVISIVSRDNQTTSDTYHYCRSGDVIVTSGVTGTLIVRASFVQAITDGVRLNWVARNVTNTIHFGAAIKGLNAKIASSLTQTNTSTPIAVTGLGNTALGGLVMSCAEPESATGTSGTHHHWSIGSFVSTSNRGAHASWDEDNVGFTEVGQAIDYNSVYVNISATDTVDGEMDVQSLDSDGATFIMTDADPTQRWFMPVLIADVAAPPAGGSHFFYRRRSQ